MIEAPVKSPVQIKLLEAADLLEKNGWIQGRGIDEYNRHCAIGAIDAVCHLGEVTFSYSTRSTIHSRSVYFAVREAFAQCIGHSNIAEWNDQPNQTQAKVVKAFRDCAESLQ